MPGGSSVARNSFHNDREVSAVEKQRRGALWADHDYGNFTGTVSGSWATAALGANASGVSPGIAEGELEVVGIGLQALGSSSCVGLGFVVHELEVTDESNLAIGLGRATPTGAGYWQKHEGSGGSTTGSSQAATGGLALGTSSGVGPGFVGDELKVTGGVYAAIGLSVATPTGGGYLHGHEVSGGHSAGTSHEATGGLAGASRSPATLFDWGGASAGCLGGAQGVGAGCLGGALDVSAGCSGVAQLQGNGSSWREDEAGRRHAGGCSGAEVSSTLANVSRVFRPGGAQFSGHRA